MRPLIGWVLAVICLVGADDPKQVLVPQCGWQPKPNDKGTLWDKSLAASSQDELDRKRRDPKAEIGVSLEKGVEVHVIERFDFRPKFHAQMVTDAEFSRAAITAALEMRANPPPPNILQVRVLTGESKDRVLYIYESDAVHLAPPQDTYSFVVNGAFVPAPPNTAASLDAERGNATVVSKRILKRAKDAEKAKNLGLALACFSYLVIHFPDTPSGQSAKATLDKAGWKVRKDGFYECHWPAKKAAK